MPVPHGPKRVIMVEFSGHTAEVVLAGELDALDRRELDEQLNVAMDKEPDALIFDMRAVTFIDVGATRTLAETARLMPGGTKPVIRNPSAPVRKLLRTARFDGDFRIEPLSGGRPGSGREPPSADFRFCFRTAAPHALPQAPPQTC